DQPERVRSVEITSNQLPPRLHHRLRHFCVSVTGKVDDVELLVDQIEVNRLGLAGGLADSCDSLPIEHRIDQARFAHVGAAHHCELWPLVTREIAGRIGSPIKLYRSNVQLIVLALRATPRLTSTGCCHSGICRRRCVYFEEL